MPPVNAALLQKEFVSAQGVLRANNSAPQERFSAFHLLTKLLRSQDRIDKDGSGTLDREEV